ncbi:MAG: hypothetical protein EOP45_12445 [Sphingobacteriaceae bacterium]|nr:MAG: hypothetical protein EOP45_12445 [Sphingobacteriaceae bacterium]
MQSWIKEASAAIPDPTCKYIELYARNVDKNLANARYLDTIQGTSRTYHAQDKIFQDGSLKDIESIGEKVLLLKRGIIVMLLRNMGSPHEKLTNGKPFIVGLLILIDLFFFFNRNAGRTCRIFTRRITSGSF